MIFDLVIWRGVHVHLDTMEIKFDGQGHRSKFTVTRGINITTVVSARSL